MINERRPVIEIKTGPGEETRIINPNIPLLSKGGGCFGYGLWWPGQSEHLFLPTPKAILPEELPVTPAVVKPPILPIPLISYRRHFADNGEERLKTREPAVSLNHALIEKISAGDNPYRRLVLNPPQCRTDKGFLAEIVAYLAMFFPEIAYQKKVFPVEDRSGMKEYFLKILEEGNEAGIATCSTNGAGRDPYWAGKAGIRTGKDIQIFFEGDKGNETGLTETEKSKYWWVEKGLIEVAKQLNLQELIITSHQKAYGEDNSRHFVARVRRYADGSFYLEFRPRTWRFRDLEGSIRGDDLIKGEFTMGDVKEITFGRNYLEPIVDGALRNLREIFVQEGPDKTSGYQDEVVLGVKNLLAQFRYLVTGDPDINAFYDVLEAFGLDQTIEFIGMDGKAKIYEVR